LAIINYDSAATHLPALRKRLTGEEGKGKIDAVPPDTDDDENPIEGTGSPEIAAIPSTVVEASWVGLILPYIEQTTAWDRLSGWSTTADTDSPLFKLALPTLKCKSDDVDGTRVSYVVNGGYQNAVSENWTTVTIVDDPARREDAPFFDYGSSTKGPTVSLDYISTHNGTSNTVLLSENIQAGSWITGVSNGFPNANGEASSAFCYPVNKSFAATTGWQSVKGGLANYSASDPDGETDNSSWKGYDITSASNPLFINRDRNANDSSLDQYSRARPSSNHPGIVIAAFADRAVRPLNENMDPKIFVRICQPASGALINPLD
jgi:hypothetical protein